MSCSVDRMRKIDSQRVKCEVEFLNYERAAMLQHTGPAFNTRTIERPSRDDFCAKWTRHRSSEYREDRRRCRGDVLEAPKRARELPSDLMTPREVFLRTGIRVATLQRLREQRIGPAYYWMAADANYGGIYLSRLSAGKIYYSRGDLFHAISYPPSCGWQSFVRTLPPHIRERFQRLIRKIAQRDIEILQARRSELQARPAETKRTL